jgi:hypothetical protein
VLLMNSPSHNNKKVLTVKVVSEKNISGSTV